MFMLDGRLSELVSSFLLKVYFEDIHDNDDRSYAFPKLCISHLS